MTLTVDHSCNNLQDTFIINPDGAKNAILPLMISKLLVPGKTTFTNVPTESEDVKTMIQILELLGLSCKSDGETLEVENPEKLKNVTIPDELASKTRYSSLLLGALGALDSDFKIPLPGGCHLQEKRPLDIHYDCLQKIGYQVDERGNYIECKTLPFHNDNISITMKNISVGATLNSIFASILRKQKTIIENVAIEPEIKNVIDFLNKSGAHIKFDEKNRKIKVIGTQKLKSVKNWEVLDDRISGMTYFMTALMHNRSAVLHMDPKLVKSTVQELQKIG